MLGIELHDTSLGVRVLRLHYTADPAKRSSQWKAQAHIGIDEQTWLREYEIRHDVASGLGVYTNLFMREIHVAKEKLLVYPDRPLYRGTDFGLCYSEDMEVLTADGWRLFRDVRKGEIVATLNPTTFELEFTPVLFTICRDYTGQMIEWRSENVDCTVTPEHRMPFSYRDTPQRLQFQSAQWQKDHITGHHFMHLRSRWSGQINGKYTPFGWDADTYTAFMGLYLSEGSCSYYKGKSGGKTVISQTIYRQEWQDVLDSTSLKFSYKANKGWTCYSSILTEHLKTYGTASKKYVPTEIKDMSTEQIRRFIQFYTDGDGHIRTRPNGSLEHTLFTVSDRMAGDMQELALKAGWYASVRKVKPQKSVIEESGGKRTITNGGGYCVTFKKKAARGELLARNMRTVDYSGKIYCLSVPYHTLYVRRNGKPHWNGNTPACVWLQVDPMGRINVLAEAVTWDGRGQQVQQGIEEFCPVMIAKTNQSYPGLECEDFADPAGWQKAQTDEKTCVAIMNDHKIFPTPGPIRWLARKEAMVNVLQKIAGGRALLQISPGCRMLIEGFQGTYRFEEIGDTKTYKEHVEKNAWSHPMNALEYVVAALYTNRRVGASKERDYAYEEDDPDCVSENTDIHPLRVNQFY